MNSIVTEVLPILALFTPAFQRAQLLAVAAILTTGRRTVANLLRTVKHLAHGIVEIRWVYVHDLTGTHRDEYLYSTDVTMTAQQIIERYTQRWNIETTYEEVRAYLGMETTQGWCPKTVLRAEPMLFGLYSVVALLYWQLPAPDQDRGTVEWLGKDTVTFSDAISAVRLWLWENWVFKKVDHDAAFEKLPQPLRQTLLYALAPAA